MNIKNILIAKKMKTKVRISKTQPEKNRIDSYLYQHLIFEFLVPMYKHESRYLEGAFTIKWQITSGAENWYGMSFNCETDRIDHVMYMAKVAKVLKDADLYYADKTPENILHLLNAERYVYDNGTFVPESLNGCRVYKINKNGKCWTTIHCFTEKQAYDFANSIAPTNGRNGDNWTVELSIPRVDFVIKDFKFDV